MPNHYMLTPEGIEKASTVEITTYLCGACGPDQSPLEVITNGSEVYFCSRCTKPLKTFIVANVKFTTEWRRSDK